MSKNNPELGRIVIALFVTLDAVAQAPGAPDEDRDGEFPFGGWQAPLFDDIVGQGSGDSANEIDALLLGRKTYDIFAAFWPHHTEGTDGQVGRLFSRIPKYVASRGTPSLEWEGTTQLGSDLRAEVQTLRKRHRSVCVMGSVDFVQTLLAERLYDELALWVFPVLLGQGKKVFRDGVMPTNLTLLAAPVTSGTGAVLLRYEPAGDPKIGDMTRDDRGV